MAKAKDRPAKEKKKPKAAKAPAMKKPVKRIKTVTKAVGNKAKPAEAKASVKPVKKAKSKKVG